MPQTDLPHVTVELEPPPRGLTGLAADALKHLVACGHAVTSISGVTVAVSDHHAVLGVWPPWPRAEDGDGAGASR